MELRANKLMVVVPCYNEEEVLMETTQRLSALFESMIKENKINEARILYVDDGSKDKTWPIIEDLSRSNQFVCGLKLAHNAGHQNALWAGLVESVEWADAVVSIDADLQDDENAIVLMVDKYNSGVEIVYGVRKERATDTVFKRSTAQGFYKMMSSMGADVVYNHADFRLMGKDALKCLLSMPERNLFLRGMVRLVGFSEDCVYYDRRERFAGESKYPLSKMFNFAIDGITSFSVKPLRMIVGFGVFFLVLAVAAIVYALVSHFNHYTIPGWTSLLISVWFLGGAILLALGVVGEYIGKIYKEVKKRPLYFVEKRIRPV
ncbi:MAG: glycosyltransferase family 2 protein [Paludibacteraceae bacterium]|nr:glycosyltransferase family 2 protein [Paludibacteraceae bacterium]